MRETQLLTLERRANEVLASVAPGVLGARIRRERLAQGLSIRELALAANLGPNSVVRLESGAGFRPITLVKVCGALGLHLDRLGVTDEADVVAVHRRSDDRWHELEGFGEGFLGGSNGVLTPTERRQVVAANGQNPLMLLQSRLPAGKLLPTLIEVHHASTPRSHPGEEFVFALRGPVQITIAGRQYTLETGDSMDFWGSELHSYAPAANPPALILSVRVNP